MKRLMIAVVFLTAGVVLSRDGNPQPPRPPRSAAMLIVDGNPQPPRPPQRSDGNPQPPKPPVV